MVVQGIEDFSILVAKGIIKTAQTTVLNKGRVFEILGSHAVVAGNMVPDHFQPFELLGGELSAGIGLLGQPGLEIGVHALGKGYQLVILV